MAKAKAYNLFKSSVEELRWTERWRIKILFPFFSIVLYRLRVENEQSPTWMQYFVCHVLPLGLIVSFYALLAVTAATWTYVVKSAWNALAESLRGGQSIWWAFGVICLLCLIAYGAKRWFRVYYGIAEIAFALSCVWFGLSDLQLGEGGDLSRSYFAVVAGIYVAVRGLENLFGGLDDAVLDFKQLIGPEAVEVEW